MIIQFGRLQINVGWVEQRETQQPSVNVNGVNSSEAKTNNRDFEEWEVTADGLWTWARNYLTTARMCWSVLKQDVGNESEDFHPYYFPSQLLACHALELGLKAFLRARGEKVKKLRGKMGHDLVKLFNRAFVLGLNDLFEPSEDLQEIVELISTQYIEQDFKYFQSKPTIDNDIDSLLRNIKRLLDAIKPICLATEHQDDNHHA